MSVESDELLSEWSSVDMLISPCLRVPGTLRLRLGITLHYFTWEPAQFNDSLDTYPLRCNSIFYVHQLARVTRTARGIGRCAVVFSFHDDKQFPALEFAHCGNMAAAHLLRFLCEIGLAHSEGSDAIRVDAKSNLYLRMNRDTYLSYSAFVEGIGHWMLLNECGFFAEPHENRCCEWAERLGVRPRDAGALQRFRAVLRSEQQLPPRERAAVEAAVAAGGAGAVAARAARACFVLSRCRSCGGVFGVLELLTETLFVLPVEEDTAVTRSGVRMTGEEASSFLFFMFVALRQRISYFGLFLDLVECSEKVTGKILEVIGCVCSVIANRMRLYSDCVDLSEFIRRNIDEVKKCFGRDNAKIIIDAILSSDDEEFSRVFVASVLIVKFIPFLDKYKYLENPNFEPSRIIEFANNVLKKYMDENNRGGENNRIYMDYIPVFLKICQE